MASSTEVKQTAAICSPTVFESGGQVRTTSRDVAELFGKNHRDVLRALDNLIKDAPDLAEGGMLSFAQTPYVEPSTGQTYRQYEMTRDGFTLLAMGFTGAKALKFKLAYIAAFNEMERNLRSRPTIDLNNPADLRMLLSNYANDKIELQGQVAELTPKAEALDRIATADGSLCITDAAKALQLRPKDLFSYLREQGWIYRRPGSGHDLGYQSKVTSGLLEHKVTTVLRADGSEKVTEQVRVTPKGLARLSALVPPPVHSLALAA